MKPEEIRALAGATCCWVAYKHVTGFGSMLGEAMLSIPISEYLKTSTSWVLVSEVQYRKLAGSEALADLRRDFAAKPTYSDNYRFILGTMFLKESAWNRARHIAADLIRLSSPTADNLRRYLLIAGEQKHFPINGGEFFCGQNLFGLEEREGRYIRPREEVQIPEFAKLYPKFTTSHSDHLSDYAYVQYGANEMVAIARCTKVQVMIWSVGRSNRLAKAGIAEA